MGDIRHREETLCWQCGNACTKGCSWATDYTPVEGWDAEKTVVYSGNVGGPNIDSYIVRECPEFVQDEGLRWEDMDDQGVVDLVEKCLDIAREDFIKGGEVTMAEVERFLRGRGASRLHRINNPDEVLKALRDQRKTWWRDKLSFMKWTI